MQIRNFILVGIFLGAAVFLPNIAFAEKNGPTVQSGPQNSTVHTRALKKMEYSVTSEKAVPVTPEIVHKSKGEVVQKPVSNPSTQHTVPIKPVPRSPNKANRSIEKAGPSLEKNRKAGESAEQAAKVKDTGQATEDAVKVKDTGRTAEAAAKVKDTGQAAEAAVKVKDTGRTAKASAKVKDTGQTTEPAAKVKNTGQTAEPAVEVKDTGQTGGTKPNAVTSKLPEVPKSLSSNQTNSEAETNSQPTDLNPKSEAITEDTESSVSIKTSSSLTLAQKPLIDDENKTPPNRKNLGDIEIMNNPPQRTQSSRGQSNELFSTGTGTISFSANRFDWDKYFGVNLGQIYTSHHAKFYHQWINAPPSPPPKAAPFFLNVI
ncbi:hypothetical protein E2K98_04740 [Bacillus salipaludis]|uniref:Uncharacterized protein n=1 Tax=Bacillus salipaludis TaxID=2547811 RepID=A0A4R5VXX4_9BACI|nr:hypothetical protein [Bacillus salipaludis]TDK64172.1 hypothetical protein E2K98_04740 [Bacillus salipaludis]